MFFLLLDMGDQRPFTLLTFARGTIHQGTGHRKTSFTNVDATAYARYDVWERQTASYWVNTEAIIRPASRWSPMGRETLGSERAPAMEGMASNQRVGESRASAKPASCSGSALVASAWLKRARS